MHNVNVISFECHWFSFVFNSPIWVRSEGKLPTGELCQDCSFVLFNANMNNVNCIDGNDDEVDDDDDDDIVMYLNF